MFLVEFNPLELPLTFPILECLHIAGFAMAIGPIALVDFRLLGVGMTKQTSSELLSDTWIWTLIGLTLVIFSGLGLYASDPDMYYLNKSFVLKMVCLVLAIVFNYTIHNNIIHRTAAYAASPASGKLVAWTSLTLWTAVVFGGIFIAFINQGLGFK